MHMDKSMCHNECKIQEHFASEKITRTSHPVYFPDLSPCDFWPFGYAKDQLKDRIITDDGTFEDKFADI
jgi:hypothetical protein